MDCLRIRAMDFICTSNFGDVEMTENLKQLRPEPELVFDLPPTIRQRVRRAIRVWINRRERRAAAMEARKILITADYEPLFVGLSMSRQITMVDRASRRHTRA